eukprot:TRINITY_DN4293_c0_g1_i1.p1 TRINITY_DN4293_c0_g1~~TRINITY_DN4293_c0_g1_i1.p1  ORF type:complete len:864 (+),score=316.19 TRINITY_DN4293_c0_g1_i1:318-2909(+)
MSWAYDDLEPQNNLFKFDVGSDEDQHHLSNHMNGSGQQQGVMGQENGDVVTDIVVSLLDYFLAGLSPSEKQKVTSPRELVVDVCRELYQLNVLKRVPSAEELAHRKLKRNETFFGTINKVLRPYKLQLHSNLFPSFLDPSSPISPASKSPSPISLGPSSLSQERFSLGPSALSNHNNSNSNHHGNGHAFGRHTPSAESLANNGPKPLLQRMVSQDLMHTGAGGSSSYQSSSLLAMAQLALPSQQPHPTSQARSHSPSRSLYGGGAHGATRDVLAGRPKQQNDSRYEKDFEEKEKLGRGGYGAVFRAINKLDHKSYAMKKIRFKKLKSPMKLPDKVLREVRCLANFDHENVVRYHGAWLEHNIVTPGSIDDSDLPPPCSIDEDGDEISDDSDKSPSNEDLNHPDGSEDDDDDHGLQSPHDIAFSAFSSVINPAFALSKSPLDDLSNDRFFDFETPDHHHHQQHNPSSSSSFHSHPHGNGVGNGNGGRGRGNSNAGGQIVTRPAQTSFQKKASLSEGHESRIEYHTTLYIQMQLCSFSLKKWISDRRRRVVPEENIFILKQIARALEYIHSKGFIHRDLKPSNIFITEIEETADDITRACLKIGDFGVATIIADESIKQSPALHPHPHSSFHPFHSSPAVITHTGPTTTQHGSWQPSFMQRMIDEKEVSQLTSSIKNSFSSSSTQSSQPISIVPHSSSFSPNFEIIPPSPSPSPSLGSFTERTEFHVGSFTTRTIGIGTPAYSSPEQLRKDEYDEKTDMYSLGIIMMELYYPFGTRMERARVLSNLREHHKLPDDFAYSLEGDLILQLTHSVPEKRPSASAFLSLDLFKSAQADQVSELNRVIAEKQRIIDDLRHRMQSISFSSK